MISATTIVNEPITIAIASHNTAHHLLLIHPSSPCLLASSPASHRRFLYCGRRRRVDSDPHHPLLFAQDMFPSNLCAVAPLLFPFPLQPPPPSSTPPATRFCHNTSNPLV
ncbi:unnamed protein product [Cyclocybe aegerita]|uniref:Uncharacterized protein n=1 Tax=Cyclocybe aegerita TaxID=1973307 RepID=A0A8S0W248_CYCAE|nr:unnamed protein product [Cyclocybe aegerita]